MDTSSTVSPLIHVSTSTDAPGGKKREFLVFRVGGIDFGMDAGKVRELRHFGSLGRIADGNRLVGGVVSLHQRVMPMVDLRSHFSTSPLLYDEWTDVIIATVGGREVCIVVDSIVDVATLAPEQIRALSNPDATLITAGLIGTADWARRKLILLDVDKGLLGPQGGTPSRLAA